MHDDRRITHRCAISCADAERLHGWMATTMRVAHARQPRGQTLAELVVATAIVAIVLVGTMSAVVAAARMGSRQNGPLYASAASYAQYSLEAMRNQVAKDPTTLQSNKWFFDRLKTAPQAWVNWNDGDDLRVDPPTGGTLKRKYLVQPLNCDGIAGADDCYAVTVKVCWNDAVNCP